MKKVLFILLAFSANSLFAQLTIDQDSVYQEYNPNEEDLAVHNFQSTTSSPEVIKWAVYSISAPANWANDFFVCDYVQCWDSTINSNSYTIADGKNYALDVHFLNNGYTGDATAKILIWAEADSLNTFQIVTYKVKVAEGVKIQEVNKVSIRTFPNPVVNNLFIENINTDEVSKIELYNIIGKRVLSIEKPNEKEMLNLTALSKGIYILKITDKNKNNYSQNILKK